MKYFVRSTVPKQICILELFYCCTHHCCSCFYIGHDLNDFFFKFSATWGYIIHNEGHYTIDLDDNLELEQEDLTKCFSIWALCMCSI